MSTVGVDREGVCIRPERAEHCKIISTALHVGVLQQLLSGLLWELCSACLLAACVD